MSYHLLPSSEKKSLIRCSLHGHCGEGAASMRQDSYVYLAPQALPWDERWMQKTVILMGLIL